MYKTVNKLFYTINSMVDNINILLWVYGNRDYNGKWKHKTGLDTTVKMTLLHCILYMTLGHLELASILLGFHRLAVHRYKRIVVTGDGDG